MLKLDLTQIKKHLKEKGVETELQTETNQLIIVLKVGSKEIPVFIRIFDGGELLQILAFLPCTFNKSTLPEVARLLHLLNKEVDMPGFGLDESNSVVFYRCMIPAKDQQVDKDIFDAILNAVQVVSTSFAPVIAAVAYGHTTFEEVTKKAKEQQGKSVAEAHLKKE